MRQSKLAFLLISGGWVTGGIAFPQAGKGTSPTLAAVSHAAASQAKVLQTERAPAGEQLFRQHCSACHSLVPGTRIVGPSLHAEIHGPHPGKRALQVRAIITNGRGTMPGFKLQFMPRDLDDLVAYLKAH